MTRLNSVVWYQFGWPWLSLRHRVMRKLQLVQSFWCTVVWIDPNCCFFEYVRRIIVIIMMMIVLVALKGAIWDFYNLLTASLTVFNMNADSGLSAILCKSNATHLVLIMCSMWCSTWYEGKALLLSLSEFHMVWRDSSAIKFVRVPHGMKGQLCY